MLKEILPPLLPLLLVTSSLLTAQAVRISTIPTSVEQVMAWENPSPTEIDTILNLCFKYVFANADTCLLLAERAVALSERMYPGDAIHAQSLLYLGDAHRSRSEWEASEKALLAGKDLFDQLGLEGRGAAAELKLGALKTKVEQYEVALDYLFSALATWERLKDSTNLFKPWFEISDIFHILKQPQKALEYNDKVLEWGRSNNFPVMTMYALNNQGIVQAEIANDFKIATDTTSGNPEALLDSMGKYRALALASLSEALPSYRKRGGRRGQAELLNILADLKADMGAYDEALVMAEEVAELSEKINAPEIRLGNTVNLAKIYRLTGRPERAIIEGKKGLVNPVANKRALLLNSLHNELYLSYKAKGSYSQALEYYELVMDFRKKNEASERNQIIGNVEAKYQTARKEKQILELNVANAAIKQKSNLYMLSAVLLTLFGFLGFQLTRVQRERNQKAAFTSALIDAQEEERKRIARDLHDGIGQSLLVIKQQLEINQASTLANRQLISDTLEEVRTISRDLHPVLLEKFGITTTVKDIVSRVSDIAPSLFVSSEISDIDGVLLPKAEVQVFRVVQEALSNVVKHAGATAAKVSVVQHPKNVEVIIRDNGNGFDYELAVARSKSLGLRTMNERISSVGGKFTIKSGLGEGTIIRLTLPLKA
jgi:signal transduction histidine kinase